MITGRDFIITSLQPWSTEIGSTIKNTALEISKQNRVLYINTPMNWLEWRKASKEKKEGKIRQINSNMWIVDLPFPVLPLNRIPFTWAFDKVNKINNQKIAAGILKAAESLKFSQFYPFNRYRYLSQPVS